MEVSKGKKRSMKLEKLGPPPNVGKKRKVLKNLKAKVKDGLDGGADGDDDSKKFLKNIRDFNFVPSGSSNEESRRKVKNGSAKPKQKQLKPQSKLYTDFTENTVFVGNIPLSYDNKKVAKLFSSFGQVACARIRCIPVANINMRKNVAAIKKQFNPKRNSAVAFVKFNTEEAVNAAVAANGMVVDGHRLRIDLAGGSTERDLNKAVFVGGLPFDIEDDELWEFFENCGKINSVRVIRDNHTTMGKGIGYVNFDSTASVELALQMDGHELKKRTINVKRCIKNTKKKNKVFGRNRTTEMVGELLSKKNKTKLKMKRRNVEKNKKRSPNEFLGNKATMKKKKKKKPSQDVLRKRKVVNILMKQ